MDVVILAGGKSTRMEDTLPKPIVSVRNKPVLFYQIDYFKDKVDNIIISVGHRANEIIDFVNSHYINNNIKFCVENEPLGTAGGIKKALLMSDSDKVVVLNHDDITDIDINVLKNLNENTVCVAHPMLPFGLIKEVNSYGKFVEKPVLDDWVNCGWYFFMRNEIINYLPDKGSIEFDVFPKINFRMFKHLGFWKPLNNKKDISEFEKVDLPEVIKILIK